MYCLIIIIVNEWEIVLAFMSQNGKALEFTNKTFKMINNKKLK